MKKFITLNMDFVGFMSSAICAIHCLLVPVLLALGLMGNNSHFLSHSFETIFFVTSFSLASIIILKNVFKEKDLKNLLIFVVGILFLGMSFINHSHGMVDILFALIGGTALCVAHFRNWNLQH